MISPTHANPIDQPIPNNGFFPDLNVKDFQEQKRVPANLADELIIKSLRIALFQVNKDLAIWKQEQIDLGFNTLIDVPQETIGQDAEQVNELSEYYSEAVFSFAMGELHPELISLLARKEAKDYMENIKQNRQEYYDEAAEMITAVKGTRIRTKSCNISSELL